MRFLISGSSGLIGSALIRTLTGEGHQIVRLVRRQAKAGELSWDPSAGSLDRAALEGFDVVIHLAGENIGKGRWNANKKAAIRDSRIKSTQLLTSAIMQLARPPQTYLSASAIGFYGDRGDAIVDETSAPGTGFLAEICKDWEAAARPAEQKGVRTCLLRTGVVLSTTGGPLTEMLLPFKMGVGGKMGSGKQYFSWITLEDEIAAILHLLKSSELRGPVNLVAPHPVTNLEFTKALGRALHRPTILPMPAFLARIALGEMVDELILASTRVVPTVLQQSGYTFKHTDIGPALAYVIGERK